MPERNLTDEASVRLRRIEGQVRGIQGMLERMTDGGDMGEDAPGGGESMDGDPCDSLLTQILAVRAAIEQVGLLILELHLQQCALGDHPLTDEQLGDLHETLRLWSRLNQTTR